MHSSETRYTDYDSWAWLYNRSEANLALQDVMPLLETLLLPHLPEKAQVLDVCCGVGQVSQQLILRDYQVTGLDGSENMLRYARENAPEGNFILDDARFFTLSPIFDAAMSTDSSLNHMMTPEDLKRVFENVYAALKDGGLFLFDLGLENRYRTVSVNDGELQADYAWTVGETYEPSSKTGTFTITLFHPPDPNSNFPAKQPGAMTQRLKRFIYNRILRPLRPAALLNLIDKNWRPSTMTFTVRSYTQTEVRAALEAVGFTQISVYDFRGKRAASRQTRYAYFLAWKPGDGQ